MSDEAFRRETRGEWSPDTAMGHTFRQATRDNTPVMVCRVCDLIWWPDQRCPKQSCKQRQAANDRRR